MRTKFLAVVAALGFLGTEALGQQADRPPDSEAQCIEAPTRACVLQMVSAANDRAKGTRVDSSAQSELAAILTAYGRHREARALVAAITYTPVRRMAFADMANSLIAAKDLEAASAAFAEVPGDWSDSLRGEAHVELVKALVRDGQSMRAVSEARSIIHHESRVLALVHIAETTSNKSLLDEALASLPRMLPLSRARVHFAIARASGDPATLEQARAQARLVPRHQAEFLMLDLCVFGFIADAREASLQLDEGLRRDEAALPLAVAAAKSGNVDEARSWARELKSVSARGHALIGIAAVTGEQTDRDAFFELLKSLPAPDEELTSSLLLRLGMAEAGERRYTDAAATARILLRENPKAANQGIWVLSSAGTGLKDRAVFIEAKTWLLQAGLGRDLGLLFIATGQAEAGFVDDALATANEIRDSSPRSTALEAAATALAKSGRYKEGLRIARTLRSMRLIAKVGAYVPD